MADAPVPPRPEVLRFGDPCAVGWRGFFLDICRQYFVAVVPDSLAPLAIMKQVF